MRFKWYQLVRKPLAKDEMEEEKKEEKEKETKEEAMVAGWL